MHQEASWPWPGADHGSWFIDDIVARVSHVARKSHVISQSSGVGASLDRELRDRRRQRVTSDVAHHDAAVVPRVSDLSAMVQSTQGKIEFDTMDDSDSDQVIAALVSLAVRQCFANTCCWKRDPPSSKPSTPRRCAHR